MTPILSRHLGAAEDHAQRARRVVADRGQLAHLALEQQPGVAGQAAGRRPRSSRGRGARRRRRRRRRGRRAAPSAAASSGSLLVSPGSKRLFSSSSTLARAERARPPPRPRRRRPPAPAATSAPSSSPRRAATGAIESSGSRSFGPPEVRDEDQRGAALAQQLDRRQRGADPGVVGDRALAVAVVERHVEVDPDEHPARRRPAASRTLALSKRAAVAQVASSGGAARARAPCAASSTQRFE